MQADVLRLPFQDASFDVVWSEGVLHHTPSTRDALASCVRVLRPGGRILFYIYRKKAPAASVRRRPYPHPDRRHVARAGLAGPGAADALRQGHVRPERDHDRARGRGPARLPAGTYNLQHFLYYNVLKFYWNDQFSFDENVHLNFDWYYPKYCWRHTVAEVRGWLKELGLKEVSLHEADSGIGVIADKG